MLMPVVTWSAAPRAAQDDDESSIGATLAETLVNECSIDLSEATIGADGAAEPRSVKRSGPDPMDARALGQTLWD